MVLSLQGCMAVGNTSAARWLEAHDPTLQVSYEDNAAVLAEVRRRGLDTARLTPDETGAAVRDWVARQRAKAE